MYPDQWGIFFRFFPFKWAKGVWTGWNQGRGHGLRASWNVKGEQRKGARLGRGSNTEGQRSWDPGPSPSSHAPDVVHINIIVFFFLYNTVPRTAFSALIINRRVVLVICLCDCCKFCGLNRSVGRLIDWLTMARLIGRLSIDWLILRFYIRNKSRINEALQCTYYYSCELISLFYLGSLKLFSAPGNKFVLFFWELVFVFLFIMAWLNEHGWRRMHATNIV